MKSFISTRVSLKQHNTSQLHNDSSEFNKENFHLIPIKKNPIPIQRMSINYPNRHSRVQSTLGLNLKKNEKPSSTSTSFQQIHEAKQPQQISNKPQFRVQRSLQGDFDTLPPPSYRQQQYRASNSLNRNANPSQEHLQRVKTEQFITQKLSTRQQNQGKSNPLVVQPYQQDIIDYLQKKVKEFKFNYLTQCQFKLEMTAFQFQNDITEKMRSILFDWIVDVHFKFKLQTQTLFITIQIIDRVLEKMQIEKSKFQLFGIAALFIACKYEEVYAVPHVRDLVYVCDNAYTKEEILKAEGHIVQILSFDLVTISPWNFLSLYQELIQMEEKNFMLTRYLIELGILEYSTMKFDCSIMACAAIYLVNKIRRINPAFPDELSKLTELKEIDVRSCAKELCGLLQNSDKKNFSSVKKKYCSIKYLEVARIKIEKKGQP